MEKRFYALLLRASICYTVTKVCGPPPAFLTQGWIMDITLYKPPFSAALLERYRQFLVSCGLRDEGDADTLALMTDDDFAITACGALAGHTLKQIAVSPDEEGQGACASIVSELMNEASRNGISRLLLCTKPKKMRMFRSMGFYPIIETEDALLMENRKNGLEEFLRSAGKHEGVCGAVVCNCDPFTLGHRRLIEYAAEQCDTLYVFLVSERGSMFQPEERLDMVRRGTADLNNCHVLSSDFYLVSRATFPAYFIKDQVRADSVKADLDIALFSNRIAPALGITKRFVGEEPFCPVTRAYNARMKELLPQYGITLIEIPRFRQISASRVRALIRAGETEKTKELVPETTYETILRHAGADAPRP